MSLRGANKLRTVCEVLREIDDTSIKSNMSNDWQAIIHDKLVEAEAMCKRMAKALYKYNKEFDKGWWEKNPDYEADLKNRLNRNYLEHKG